MEKSLYDVHLSLTESHWWFRGRSLIVNTLLRKYLGSLPYFQNVADIGSGGGSMVETLKKISVNLSLLEPDICSAEWLSKKYRGEKVEVFQGFFKDWKNKEPLDFISLFDVLEHIEDDRQTLRDIHRRLRNGGFISITVPAFQFLWSKHDEENFHKRRYTKRELTEKLREAGFEILGTNYFNFFLFPLIVVGKKLGNLRQGNKTDFSRGKDGILGKILFFVFGSERFFLKHISFPFGVSIFCIAKKNDREE